MAQFKDDVPLNECCPISDVFAMQLATVEILGPCARLTFAVEQTSTCDGRKERLVVAKLVLPLDMVRSLPIDLPAMMGDGASAVIRGAVSSNLN